MVRKAMGKTLNRTEMQSTDMVLSPCGAYRLLAAIFRRDPRQVLRRKGLWQPRYRCRGCGKDMDASHRLKYCPDCRLIPITCDQCGKTTLRNRCDVIAAAKRGSQHQFCSRVCHGMWVGHNVGFFAHPENSRGRRAAGVSRGENHKWSYPW